MMTNEAQAALARALHYIVAKQSAIYNEGRHIDTSWAADGRNRGVWYDRAGEIGRVLEVLGWSPPATPTHSVELSAVQLEVVAPVSKVG